MKFAKGLDEEAVPEWRDKYLDYKGGKKKLKAVARAVRNVDDGASDGQQERKSPYASLRDGPIYSLFQRERQQPAPPPQDESRDSSTPLFRARSDGKVPSPVISGGGSMEATPKARAIDERSPLQVGRGKGDGGPKLTRYGSIMGTPPDGEHTLTTMERLRQAPSLELPEPAVAHPPDDEDYDRPVSPRSRGNSVADSAPRPPPTQLAHTGNAYQIAKPTDAAASTLPARRYSKFFQTKRAYSTPNAGGRRPFMRRVFSIAAPSAGSGVGGGPQGDSDVALEAYREVDFRQAEFFLFLDKELHKIETFYQLKEDEARERLKVLREQLHIMRDRRLEEIVMAEQRHTQLARSKAPNGDSQAPHHPRIQWDSGNALPDGSSKDDGDATRLGRHPLKASMQATRDAVEKLRAGRVGKTSKAMNELGSPENALGSGFGVGTGRRYDATQDYSRRPTHAVPYRTAKRKLKVALAEFYRGLELLKSYALLNRTAFRKINKKYDKTVHAYPTMRYMSEKVNKAHFVQSTTPDDLITTVEDLYARYFERGNHKVAVGKLRAKAARPGAYTAPIFRAGLLLAAGAVFAIQGVVAGFLRLEDDPAAGPEMQTYTSYLLQIYAGYFLMLLLVGWFCVDAMVFTAFRVNYQFIFEFDTRHMLDWKQLVEIPTYFFFLLGFCMWANFSSFGTSGGMYVYWPVILIGLSVLLLCCPPPFFYSRSRKWFLTSNYRVLLAGAFPVEFRDFFLGDMYCSQTYALGNLELFFCLYARHWKDPPQCNSNHSMLLGFFSTLPGLWRLFQCFRRYYDSGLWTHLANGAKYTCTILQYLSLSVWRIYGGYHLMAFFIVSATLNGAYCSFWDLNYDWSMPLNIYSKPWPLLRPTLAYRKRIWWYYAAMFLDPILRFNWIFYVIYKDDLQHSSLVSFFISFSEVMRRGIWVLFRVENEHCTNVGRYRAQRDPALPYEVKESPDETETELEGEAEVHGTDPAVTVLPSDASASGRDVEAARPTPTSGGGRTPASLRLRRAAGEQTAEVSSSPVYAALKRAGSTFMTAHAQDYERKRKPPAEVQARKDVEEDEEEDDDEGESDSDGD